MAMSDGRRHAEAPGVFYIAGAGGFGREVAAYAAECLAAGRWSGRLGGFLDDTDADPAAFGCALPVVSTIDGWCPGPDDRVVVAVGDPAGRRQVALRLAGLGARFVSLIHPTAWVAASARLGEGCIVAPLAAKLVDAKLGTRMRPFAAFSTHAPSELTRLAYAARHTEAVKLADAVLAQVTDAPVKKAAQDVNAAAEALGQKIQGLVNPQAVLTGAMATRDALLPDWHAQWNEFKTQLRAGWSKEPGKVAFVLAPPPVLVVGKKKAAKKPVTAAQQPAEPT